MTTREPPARTYTSHTIDLGGFDVHYLEAGTSNPESVVLLHSGEFGASAELSWEYTIDALAEHFHVLAPDFFGFGESAKVFDFERSFEYRVEQIARFLDRLDADGAHFIGNSMGGSMLARIACRPEPPWDLRKIVLVSGGGAVPENEAREVLQTYDGSVEHMERILGILFGARWWDDDYVERRVDASRQPGAWEATAAVRFSPPFETGDSALAGYADLEYGAIHVPTLIVAGGDDPLREPGYAEDLRDRIPDAELVVFDEGRHCPHIEFAAAVNERLIDFLR